MLYEQLIDTDVLIWYLRGNPKAYQLIHGMGTFCISSVTYMELVQGMRNKEELRTLQKIFKQWGVKTLYVSEEISARALFLVEEYFLSHSMELADALIAATALQYGMKLITANDKHYRIVEALEIEIFRA
ncbi:MAG: twitching motility protein PilT [Sulfuricurvum sp. PC08-66]|nr:MAG: twitching motility protein PilT [Sulfuricurvum sp. PC08-66]